MNDPDLAAATTVLVVAPRDGGAETCVDLLADRRPDRLIVVPVGSTPARGESRLDARPELSDVTTSYVEVKTAVQSAGSDGPGPTPVATVSSPADLPTLGTVLDDGLAHAAREDEHVGVCLHSVSEMLGFVDREFLFRFLHTLGARVRRVDGVVYYHLDADAGEEPRTLFAQISDAVVTDEDGERTVSSGLGGDTVE